MSFSLWLVHVFPMQTGTLISGTDGEYIYLSYKKLAHALPTRTIDEVSTYSREYTNHDQEDKVSTYRALQPTQVPRGSTTEQGIGPHKQLGKLHPYVLQQGWPAC